MAQTVQSILNSIFSQVQSKFKVTGKVESDKRASIQVDRSQIVEVADFLKSLGFDHVKSVTAIDYPDAQEFEVVYHISSYSNIDLAKTIVALRTRVKYDDPKLPSLYKIWESVWTGERETYEMYGIIFEGHPDLRRLFLPEDFEGVYPMRKSYKIKTEGLFVDKPS
ncbi:NADH-quinone oxidoreductase subunit C [Sulfurisphaera ohwakuensis]|uniref:NADH-quinone oxidoreductase subunit C n=1 Tax=Sulfurisphaera ohwakuensis TaxID=69656 RepID=A0A650CJ51_SULOH|nr:NADH-quinone oxidoreductase subunit C [Sulfurisphaera ohwakuensis]MBB5253963.1 NADH-quinone oxidoreductase subunit C [Sulfurisphaera ohwakuensis]QGR17850.1 NADH-quinone oxidoreductase subunit C [Sulfurisphaera ohwakuensis]